MENYNKMLEFVKNSLNEKIKFINYKRFTMATVDYEIAGRDETLIQDWEKILGANDKYNFLDIDVNGLADNSLEALMQYKNMIFEMITSKGISKDVVFGVSEILNMIYKCTNRSDFDPMSLDTLEKYCNMFLNEPMEFFENVNKPLKEAINELKQLENAGIKK